MTGVQTCALPIYAKYLAHLPHQTQKWRFMRSQKLYNMATILLQICNGTDKCCKNFIVLYFLFSLLSLHFFFSLLSHSLVPSLFSLYRFPLSSTSPGCSLTATTACSATLDQPRLISPMLDLTYTPATLDLTHAQPRLISPISPRGRRRSHPLPSPFCLLFTLPLSGFFFFFFFCCNLG